MTGIVGGRVSENTLDLMQEQVNTEEWYESERFHSGDAGLALIHHGEKDPYGHATWDGDAGVGVLYGVFSNRTRLGLSTEEIFKRILDRPTVVLPKLSGPFLLATIDREGNLLVASDKLGTRNCYFATSPKGMVFSSDLSAVADQLDNPTVDVRTTSDLLSFNFAFGDKTLIEGVESLSPGTVLRKRGSDLELQRYWEPTFGQLPEEGYVNRLLRTFSQTVSDVSTTIRGDLGLWLSGGLDSRTLAGILREEFGRFRTFTYDSNPADESNFAPARRVAENLGVDNDVVFESPNDFMEYYEKSVRICDGMAPYQNLIAPAFIFGDLHSKVDVMMEAAPQGELFGEAVRSNQLKAPTAVSAFKSNLAYSREPADKVRSLLTEPVDPDRSIREAVAESNKSSVRNRVLDVWLRNIPANSHFRGNKSVRSQVGMRIPFADGDFLDTVAGMPQSFYRGSVPGTSGRIPRSMSPLKRALVCELNAGLDEIPYERTRFAVKRPLILHDAGYIGKQLVWRFLTGRPARWRDWYREHQEIQDAVNGWLDSARDRQLFDGDVIEELRHSHLSGEANNWGLISGILNLEVWMEETFENTAQVTTT